MRALLDLGLFVLGPEEWKTDRESCLRRIAAVSLHDPWLRKEPVSLVWSDTFFEGFPWNEPECPPQLRDLCVSLTQLRDTLQGRKRLLFAADLPPPPADPKLNPDLSAGPYPPELKIEFRSLAASAVASIPSEVSVPTVASPLIGQSRTMAVLGDEESPPIGSADLLLTDEDWRAFLLRFKKPDLAGKRVAVLGGTRAPFERARAVLEGYGLSELRRLPPAFEETRTKQQTLQRLEKMDLLLVCTNRCKHTDTDHVKGELACARVDLNSDGDTALVASVLAHFRAR